MKQNNNKDDMAIREAEKMGGEERKKQLGREDYIELDPKGKEKGKENEKSE